MTMIEVEPQPRIDTLVRLPDGGEARRTEYVGTVWFDGKPEVSGLTLRRSPQRAARHPDAELPDIVLRPGQPAVQPGRARRRDAVRLGRPAGSGETSAIVDAAATFTDDPSGAPTWIQVHVRGHLGWPAGVGYRIVALTPARRGSVGHKRPRRLVDRTLSQ